MAYEVDNNSYDAIKVDASYWDGTSEKSKLENYTPVADTPEKRFLEFIYNEYAREFNVRIYLLWSDSPCRCSSSAYSVA